MNYGKALKRAEEMMLKKRYWNKKGQTLNLVIATVVGLLILILTVFAALFGIATLDPATFFTAGSASRNATQALQDNTTTLVSNFSQRLVTVGTVLGVVLVLGALAILILYVTRFRGAAGAGGSPL